MAQIFTDKQSSFTDIRFAAFMRLRKETFCNRHRAPLQTKPGDFYILLYKEKKFYYSFRPFYCLSLSFFPVQISVAAAATSPYT
jgi:hypothetical protein